MRGVPRASIRAEYTATPDPNGPRSAKLRLVFVDSATKRPFLVPIVRMTRFDIFNLLKPREE